MKLDGIINQDSEILGGMPIFAGTRVPVQTLVDYLIGGESLDDFLEGFPSVPCEQVKAFLEMAFSTASVGEKDARAA